MFDYQGDFVPCPTEVTLNDDTVSLEEIAQQIYLVATHPVKYKGEYIAGEAKDADRHKLKL